MQWTRVIFLVAMVTAALAAVQEDLVTSLPGLATQPTYKHYSGYLKATGTKRLHYWFIEAQSSPTSAPVVLWMNGGPGCSSMDGLLTEHGPFTVADEGKTIQINPYSWNLVANMLYLEAPAGVGYSYSLDKNYTTSDDEVSLDNYAALKYFFSKYPEFSSNEFYITGESYGGIYVPTLAARVVEDRSFNFKGFAVGNGLSDRTMNDNSMIYFGYFHGLWGKSLWNRLVTKCCVAGNTSDCDFAHTKDMDCVKAVGDAGAIIGSLNIYNMYAECLSSESVSSSRSNVTVIHSTDIMLGGSPLFTPKPLNVYAAMSSGTKVSVSPPCVDTTAITNYMNREDVKTAIHIVPNSPKWEICSGVVGALYKRVYNTMESQYMKVLSTGQHRILVYNGDVDMACNFLMDEWFTDSLGIEVMEENRAWNYKAKDGTTQIGGYVKDFKNLRFTTIRGAGHMVPTDRPIPALNMFTAFLHNQRL